MKRLGAIALLLACAACKDKEKASAGPLFSEDGFRGNFEERGRSKDRRPKKWAAHVQPPPPVRRPPPPPLKLPPQAPFGDPPVKRRPAPMDAAAKAAVPGSPQAKGSGKSMQASAGAKDESQQEWNEPERPDDVDPGAAVSGSRYLSPARPKDMKVKGEAAAGTAKVQSAALAGEGAPVGSAAPELGAPMADMKADIPAMLVDFSEENGSYRVQISATEDFKTVLSDKTYPFLEDFDPKVEMRKSLSKGGHYWVRSAFIDLLEFQHPFSKPKHYYVRHRDLWGP